MAASVPNELRQLNLNSDDDLEQLDCRTFFRTYTEDGKTISECLVENCTKKKLSGKQKFNLERHLTTVHRMKFANAGPSISKDEVTLKIRMSPATVFRSYVHSLTLDGRPLAIVNDGGMRMLLNPILKAFDDAKTHLDLSIPNVKKYLTKYTQAVKDEISKEIANSIIHVKLDLASRQRKSILGINVQFMKDGEIVVRTLSMMQTHSSHNGEYICALLLQTLDEYNIKYSQIHSITTDNGRNVVRMVKLFSEVENAEVFVDDDLDLGWAFPGEDVNSNNNHGVNSDDENDDGEDDGEQQIDGMEVNLNEAVRLFGEKTKILNGIRCAAHTLQLVINTALKKTEYAKKLIAKCRHIVKSFLAPNMLCLIRQQNLRSPLIDCATRWSSTYYMLERLIEHKEFYKTMISFMPARCKMSESDWHNLDGILRILSQFEIVTKKLQSTNFTVADFYCAWHELKFEMEAMAGVELVDKILVEMAKREIDMMQNDIIYSCVFMDPRYRILLSEGTNFIRSVMQSQNS